MAYYTLGQAAKATGKTKTTISNAIKKGRVSAFKNDIGHYQIEISELHRVFEPVNNKQSIDESKVTALDPKKDPLNPLENKMVQELLKVKDEQIDQMKQDHELIKGLITNQSEQATKEIENLRARVEQAETDKEKAIRTAKYWKNEASKPWYRKLFK